MKKHLCLIGLAAAVAIGVCGCGNAPEAAERTAAAAGRDIPAVTTTAPSREITVVFLGDSVGRGTGDETGRGFNGILQQELEERGFDADSVNLAIDGARTRHILDQLQRSKVRQQVSRADVVVLSIGGNDLFIDAQGRRADIRQAQSMAQRVLERVGRVIGEIRRANQKARIVVLGLYNPFFDDSFAPVASAYVKQWNDMLVRRFHQKNGVTVVETFDLLNQADRLAFDRFHPSAKGYELVSERIADTVRGQVFSP